MRTIGMTDPTAALQAILTDAVAPKVEELALERAAGRFLPRSITARLTLPPFDKAAVDGIAIRADDKSERFRLVGTVTAGDPRPFTVSEGECVTIMTGAPVPPGIGRIIRVENTREENGVFRVLQEDRITNIACRGENINPGETLLTPRRLNGVDIGIAASHGYATLPVSTAVAVSVIATGTELAVPGQTLGNASIYDGNSYQLAALAAADGAAVDRVGIVPDLRELQKQHLAEALDGGGIVIISGGVSMGELDLVPELLQELGVTTVFHGLAMKPGRPTFFGRRGETAVFGLPGNPVSTVVQYELFIRPLLWQRQGVPFPPREGTVRLARPFRRKNADRHEYRPVSVDETGVATAVPYMGSGHIAALAHANALIRIDQGVDSLAEGAEVYARYLR